MGRRVNATNPTELAGAGAVEVWHQCFNFNLGTCFLFVWFSLLFICFLILLGGLKV